eukprot:CAMPEP_0174701858 /NCGR_PEP_ID=MMETSP1094-20130205/6356_1 /TAXON_ID=156173 /ORGANISM="Chrysochromulina brevifilum, Strain UTEX LB 985" /LENGTH=85 /DNA_ID=CAMNT_0015899563 /DNA_START=92 /DNA_END=349 /DNA_ORIENTATION=+
MEEAVAKLRKENEVLEAEIEKLSTKGATATGFAASTTKQAHTGSGIKVMDFGSSGNANPAGVNYGSAWCPPQTHRRTLLGGFFTS